MASKNAHDQLRAWMQQNGRSYVEVADLLQISTPHLSHLVTGGRRPSLRLALRVETLTGISVRDWPIAKEVA